VRRSATTSAVRTHGEPIAGESCGASGDEGGALRPLGDDGEPDRNQGAHPPGDKVVLEADFHIFNYELGMIAAFSGALPRPIPTERGVLPVEAVAEAIRPEAYYLSRTGLICVENTHNRKAGVVYPLEQARELLEFAHAKGIPGPPQRREDLQRRGRYRDAREGIGEKLRFGDVLPLQGAWCSGRVDVSGF